MYHINATDGGTGCGVYGNSLNHLHNLSETLNLILNLIFINKKEKLLTDVVWGKKNKE